MIQESLTAGVSKRLYFKRESWRPGGGAQTPHGQKNAMEYPPIQGRFSIGDSRPSFARKELRHCS